MALQIRFLFKALDLDAAAHSEPAHPKILECIQRRKCQVEAEHKLLNLKTYLRIPAHNTYQYFEISSDKAERAIHAAKECIVVEFFHGNRGESVRAKLASVNGQLARRERELKVLMSQLEDESRLFYAMQIISKTSKASFSDFEDVIQVTVAVSEPLVECRPDRTFPLFYEQIDVCSHIERLRRASIAQCSLSIRANRTQASRKALGEVLDPPEKARKITNIVQLFTRVERNGEKVMVSLEGAGGEQVWVQAEQLLANSQADLLIVIGIGAHLLEQVPYAHPLILLTSVSVEENRLGDTSYSRDKFAITFLEVLFSGIFKRFPLGQAFSAAKREASQYIYNYLWCCCLHGHAGDCGWSSIVQRVGSQQAHRLFRHSFEEWKALKFYPLSNALQNIILGKQNRHVVCAKDNFCCWNRQGVNKLQLHQNLTKLLLWNGQEYSSSDGMMVSLKLNKFQPQSCDRPIVRTRPLTVYRVLQLLSMHRISVLRAPDLSLARRLLSQAVDYMRCRDSSVTLCELEMYRQVRVERQLFGYLQSLKPKAGAKLRLLVVIVERQGGQRKHDYQSFLQDPRIFLHNARLVYQLQIALSFVVVTANPSFEGEYPTLHLATQPHPDEKYYEILHSYRSEHLSPDNPQCHANLHNLREQILQGAADNKQQVRQKCQQIRNNAPKAYLFLGFLALFGEEGLYLTKSTTPILEQMFTASVMDDAVGRQLPVEASVFPNCVYLQMAKPYREQLSQTDGEIFSLKRLEYYNLLLRLYVHFVKPQGSQSFMGSFIRKQGLFCISIEPQDTNFATVLQNIALTYRPQQVKETLYSHTNFKPIYHINQIEKIITEALKKKRPKQFQAVKVTSLNEKEMAPHFLLWSIMQKLSILLHSLQRQFSQKVRQTHNLITVYLLKGEVRHTIVEIARIQLSLILQQRPQKLAEGLAHEQLSSLLTFIHLYSIRLSALTAAGASPHKFKQALYNCFSLVYKLKESCECPQVRAQFSRHKMSATVPDAVWYRQLLRLIQRKIVFYFSINRSSRGRSEEERDFRRLINLGEIRYQFQNLYYRLPQAERKDCNLLLIDHYIRISLNEARADNSLLFTLKCGIAAELQPIYQHLCLKVDKKTLFSGKRLVVVARARNSFANGLPYIFNRKRYLTVPYLSQLLEGTALKSSYFNLTTTTIHHLAQAAPSQVTHLLVSIDAEKQGEMLLIGSDTSVEAVSMPVADFANQVMGLNLKMLILMGRSAVTVGQKIQQSYQNRKLEGGQTNPFVIALQSSDFSMNDHQLHEYPPANPSHACKYLQNQVYLMALDFIALSIVWKINEGLKAGKTTFALEMVTKIVEDSIRLARRTLLAQFQCVDETFKTFRHRIWGASSSIDKIEGGIFQDLTSKFYSSEHNFYHYKYYQNVGRCAQILSILSALRQKRHLIEIVGGECTGKTTILHEVTWTAQIKGFFQLGISIFDAKRNLEELKEYLMSRKFKERTEGICQASVMISIDNLTPAILEQQREIFEKLKNKAIIILFTAQNREASAMLSKIVGYNDVLTIDINRVELQDVFGLLLSNIKDIGKVENIEEATYTHDFVSQFQDKIDSIMKEVELAKKGEQISEAIRLVKGRNSTQTRHDAFYNFYKVNYDRLAHKLMEKKEMEVRIV